MSLYSWLRTDPVLSRKNPEQSFWKYCSTHEQQLLEDPKYIYWNYMPPTFVTYQLQMDWDMMVRYYGEQIKATILKYLSDATDEQVDIIMNKVLSNINPNIEINIEEKVNQAFSELGILTEEDINEITSS